MNNKVLLLRVCYWLGAVLDGIAAIIMMFPGLYKFCYNLPDYNLDMGFKTATKSITWRR